MEFSCELFGTIRTIIKDNEPWFIAKDIATILDYSGTEAMTRRLDQDEVIHDKLSGMNMMSTLINESGLYVAILGSSKPNAKLFKKWVTKEVLPAIRKHGAYATPATIENIIANPDFGIELLTKLKEQNSIIEHQKQEIEYKQEVIQTISDDVSLSDKRNILNQVVRKAGHNFQNRWQELYRHFDMKYHMSVERRLEAYNKTSKRQLTKLDYIEQVLGKLPELYEIAVKLYESEVKSLVRQLYSVR